MSKLSSKQSKRVTLSSLLTSWDFWGKADQTNTRRRSATLSARYVHDVKNVDSYMLDSSCCLPLLSVRTLCCYYNNDSTSFLAQCALQKHRRMCEYFFGCTGWFIINKDPLTPRLTGIYSAPCCKSSRATGYCPSTPPKGRRCRCHY